MKNLILTTLAVLLTYTVTSQTTITFKSSQTCFWNPATQNFDICNKPESNNSSMVVNQDQTIFIHTTMEMKSSYYVNGTEHEERYFQYYVTSDVGNSYLFAIDIDKNLFKIMGAYNGRVFITMYGVKAVF